MKQINSLLAIAFTVIFVLFLGLSSCSKDDLDQNRVANATDTLYVDMPITTDMLCGDSLQIEEVRGVRGCSVLYYNRGAGGSLANTESFDNEFIKFHPNNTGLYHQDNGIERVITWSFLNPENTKLIISFTNTPASFDVIWENIRYKNGKWYFDEYYTDGNTGEHSHAQFIKVSMP